MTETYVGATTTPEDIDDDMSAEQARLEQEADAILLEGEARAFGPRPIHEAVREDAMAARDWSRARAERLRRAVEDEPMKAALYALGVGLVIGLLIGR